MEEQSASEIDVGEELLKLIGVTKRFGSETIFDRLDLAVTVGQHLLIQRPSGCGKTTLLRCMALIESIQEGRIEYFGKTVAAARCSADPDKDVRLNISIVFQHLYLWPHLSVLENVALPLKLLGATSVEAKKKSEHMLQHFGIGHKRDEFPNSLSGGQQQRVALARAFVHTPKLFLLDEITANLDATNIDIVMENIRSICDQGTTVIMVTHGSVIPKGVHFDKLTYDRGSWTEHFDLSGARGGGSKK